MKRCVVALVLGAALVAAACGGSNTASPTSAASAPVISFFVSSAKSTTGNLGGLRGADALCQSLAAAAGAGAKTWRAYLSVERDADNSNRPTDARSRIGNGPWANVNGVVVARDLAELHARKGDAAVFVDERGQRINGQWTGSPSPVEHDILTGSNSDGALMTGFTCNDWTSDATSAVAQVGHSDGLGPNGDTSGALSSWNSAHANQNCANTAPRGGAGRIYCFAR
ncbi:MAG: hypothetical protein AUH43_03700 [Acidobacteria bacterium 13_1_40CM_65_14]|nr:MAG: hypothetical protein AUH43_03700 [Acidobacteria bacterium 13_1_40CM_65_14]OLE84057.1 MAG: hypothetical protein AUF76_04520 [Acidobacteria bacterium 13_1_20CM_2_65_9]